MILPERIAAELTRLHRPGIYYTGLNERGRQMLNGGPGVEGPFGVSQVMNRYTRCVTCRHDGPGNQWPCETAALLVEAGLMPMVVWADPPPRVEPADPAADG